MQKIKTNPNTKRVSAIYEGALYSAIYDENGALHEVRKDGKRISSKSLVFDLCQRHAQALLSGHFKKPFASPDKKELLRYTPSNVRAKKSRKNAAQNGAVQLSLICSAQVMADLQMLLDAGFSDNRSDCIRLAIEQAAKALHTPKAAP